MPRALFEKTGNAVYISHLDLMRLFQRAFKRAGLPLTHTQGYNPRPSVSIALPLSLGVESRCELLDFELEGDRINNEEICQRLNACLIDGVKVLQVYENADKIKNISLLSCKLTLEYDRGVPAAAMEEIRSLFEQSEILVEKKGKHGITEQNISQMIRRLSIDTLNANELVIRALICCQNPTVNPMQLIAAIEKYLPEYVPDFIRCSREEIYDTNEVIFR